jgi:heme-degrading monooxygenase HmoA
MHARVTLLEIDVMRTSIDAAVARFAGEVLPQLRTQPGYRGVLALTTTEGKAALVSLWDTAAQADAGGQSGFYPDTLARFVTLFASPPGREQYEVALADLPAPIRS